jgi:hypothetical protein
MRPVPEKGLEQKQIEHSRLKNSSRPKLFDIEAATA